MSEFHVRDGWFFSRDDESTPPGAVTVRVQDGPTFTLAPHEWASVVASVSAHGETGETYRAALDFHQDAES
jgi:hypothetical protein